MITNSHKETEEMMMNAVCAVTDEYGFENFTTKVWGEGQRLPKGIIIILIKWDILERRRFKDRPVLCSGAEKYL